jgi:ABC-type sugar transport system permease subunit
MLPLLAIWFVFHIYPNIKVFGLSLYKWNGVSDAKSYIGFKNFQVIFKSKQWFRKCFFNTSAYVIFTLAVQLVLALALALTLRRNNRINNALRTLFFIPIVLSSVAVSMIWRYMYDVNVGFLHNVFKAVGLDALADFQYLSGRYQRLFFISVVQVWSSIGVPITLFTAAFQAIPEEIYEASSLDGANDWQTFWDITFPQIKPTILRVMMLTISGAAMAFDYVLMLGVQNPDSSAPFDTWSVTIYKTMVADNNYGMVAANSTVLAVFLLIIMVAQYYVTRHAEDQFM